MSRNPGAPYDPKTEEVFHLKGDAHTGYATQLNLDHSKREVLVRYKDFLLTVDVYRLPETPMKAILYCPRCRNVLTITADKKQMSYEPTRNVEAGGELSVEAFQCTWELDQREEGRRMEFGLSLCKLRLAIDKNIAKDA